ncbi:MAG: hypothetical protein R3343_11390 [Nitriliruptorales bacterium]|nr:hypothetical protein [Nitriliruptorales bacterium]
MAPLASLVATVVSARFAWQLLARWRERRRNVALGYWGASLAMFSLASAALLAGALIDWTSPTFRVFYLFGAVLNVPWLALGSSVINAPSPVVSRVTGSFVALTGVLLLPGLSGDDPLLFVPGVVLGVGWGVLLLVGVPRATRVGAPILVGLFTAVSVVAVLGADLVAPIPAAGLPEGRELFPIPVRGLAVGGNAVGAVLVIVSAVAASANVAWGRPPRGTLARARAESVWGLTDTLARWFFAGRRGAGRGHVIRGNLLIALGVLVAAAGGALSFLGETTGHAVGLGLGVIIMYAGFVRTTRPVEEAGSVGSA